jgi:putative membrane protein (TIGR04086 family)
MTKLDTPEAIVSLMSSVALCVGAYSGGYISSRRRRQNGLITGLICGVIIYLVIFLVGVILSRVSISFGFFSKLIMVIACGAIGGVIGVNSKKKRY